AGRCPAGGVGPHRPGVGGRGRRRAGQVLAVGPPWVRGGLQLPRGPVPPLDHGLLAAAAGQVDTHRPGPARGDHRHIVEGVLNTRAPPLPPRPTPPPWPPPPPCPARPRSPLRRPPPAPPAPANHGRHARCPSLTPPRRR